MRLPEQAAISRPRLLRGYQLAIAFGILAVILAFVAVQLIADAYTNYLWFGSLHLSMIWRSMAETRAGLGFVFTGTFFVACWLSLFVADALAPGDIYSAVEYELARRYRSSLGRYRVGLRTLVAFLLALAVGLGASGQWQHWLLFLNGGRFGLKDPQFHRDIGFFVFRLPFLSFLVDWSLVALVVLLIVTAVAHYLNGAIRTSGPAPHVDARATAHLSLILALIALVRAAAYFFVDRFDLDLSTNGLVVGAGYTDVHVRLPALSILAVVSMIAFALLTYNVYHRSWTLPAVAVGIWAFIAVAIGMVYPAMVQWLKVNPSQATVELPYLQRNIAGTRAAYGLSKVQPVRFQASSNLQPSTVEADMPALSQLPLWTPRVAGSAYDALEALRSYYRISGLATDRYQLGSGNGESLTPVVIGARQIDSASVPRHSWVAEHLLYTHGYGVVLSPANAVSPTGRPLFDISGVPSYSTNGAPIVRQPAIYFGANSSSSYAVVDTKISELDYPTSHGSAASHFAGPGGVRLSGFWQRAAFAMRFHDLNLLDSGLITKRSRILFVQDVRQRVAMAAPFLRVDSHPYPVVAGGRVYWMVDCYTTSDTYPYSEGAATSVLGPSDGLQGQYNYVRNSVEAVVNAYSGSVTFFALQPNDPVLRAWERTYPGLIKPLRKMGRLSPALYQHLRYSQSFLMLQSAMYGRYHYAPTPAGTRAFYRFEDSWTLAEGSGAAPYVPTYEVLRLPGRTATEFVSIEPLVPFSTTGRTEELAAFMAAESGYSDYGRIICYVLPQVKTSALGPDLVAARLQLNKAVVHEVALLRSAKARVTYGAPLLVPIEDSFIYIQSIFVSSDNGSAPVLADVAVDLNGNEVRFAPTLEGALRAVFGPGVHSVGTSASGAFSAQVATDLNRAYAAYERSVYDGKHFQLGAMQKELAEVGRYLKEVRKLVAEERAAASRPSPSRPGAHGGGSGASTTTSGHAATSSTSSALRASAPRTPRPGGGL